MEDQDFYEKEGFRIRKRLSSYLDNHGDHVLCQMKQQTPYCVDFMRRNGYHSLWVAGANHGGNPITSLDFLQNCDFLKEINVLTPYEKDHEIDVSSLNTCSNLEDIGAVLNINQEIDLRNFPNLKSLTFIDSSNWKNLKTCSKLEHLCIWYYKQKDLQELTDMKNLDFLTLSQKCNLDSLGGIEHLLKLRTLQINRPKNLKNLEGLSANHSAMIRITIDSAKKLENIDSIKYLTSIQSVNIFKSLVPNMEEHPPESWNLPNIKFWRVTEFKSKRNMR